MLRAVITVLLLCASSCVAALDEKDLGIYLVVHSSGNVTSEAFRVFQDNEGWQMQARQSDGSWKDVVCGNERCTLRVTSPEQIRKMFDAKALSQIAPDCVNSRSFAFCRYTLLNNPQSGGYLWLAIDRDPAIQVRLVKSTASTK